MKKIFGITISDKKILDVINELELCEGFSFVVTPNMQHLVAINQDNNIMSCYTRATLTLCDSRIVQLLAALLNKPIVNVIPGSDLTKYYFEHFFKGDENIMIVGSLSEDIVTLKRRYNLTHLSHYNPPMGFIDDPVEVEKVISEISVVKPRYLFLAVGFPRQELMAARLKDDVNFDCIALCIGASVDFMTGKQKRAPESWQKLRIEWLYRYLKEPKRMFRRYFIESWGIFPLMVKEMSKKDD